MECTRAFCVKMRDVPCKRAQAVSNIRTVIVVLQVAVSGICAYSRVIMAIDIGIDASQRGGGKRKQTASRGFQSRELLQRVD